MNLENLDEQQIKDLNKNANKAARALFEAMWGEFSEDELKFISDVLAGVKERSGGSVHISFDHGALVKSKNKGKSVDDVLDEIFSIIGDVESGKIKSEPLKFDDSQKGWCGPNCECYPDPASESEEDKALRLKQEAKADEIISKHLASATLSKNDNESFESFLEHVDKNSKLLNDY
jgi:hypothetical protein